MRVDLHLHTNCSDGGCSVQELFDILHQNDVKVASITDHINIDAYKKLDNVDTYGIRIIKGIEVDVLVCNCDLHILLYGYNESSKLFGEYITKMREFDIKNFEKMIDDLVVLYGLKFDRAKVVEFENRNEFFDKVRLNNFLVELGYAPSPRDAFYTYTHAIEDKARNMILPDEFFAMAKESGAVSVFAHPLRYLSRFGSLETIKDVIVELKDLGLDGVEVFNNHETKEQQNELLKFVKKNHLLISAGSDYHNKIGAKDPKMPGFALGEELTSDMISKRIMEL